MNRLFLHKLTRLSLINPQNHQIHGIMQGLDEAYYVLIYKDNGAYLLASTPEITYKIGDQVELLSNKTGNHLDYGTIKAIYPVNVFNQHGRSIKDLVGDHELYLYLVMNSPT